MRHLELDCVLDDASPHGRDLAWQKAASTLGERLPRPGQPEILALPESARGYISQQVEPLALKLGFYNAPDFSPPHYCLVELAPLLAHQLFIQMPRVPPACACLPHPPDIRQMLPICLPHQAAPEPFDILLQHGALLVTSRSVNIHFNPPRAGDPTAAMSVGQAPPFVTVVERGGAFHLWDGYHRAYGLAKAGATHMPCMLRHVVRTDLFDAVAHLVFPADLMSGDNPPTIGHFIGDRAFSVKLKTMSRVMQVSWTEWMIAEA
jgi:hypothetical protein